jgi:hypothetical protein
VLHIGFHVQSVPSGHDFGFSPYGECEFAAGHKGGLGMVVGMLVALCAFREGDFDHHDLAVVSENLAGDPFTSRFPRDTIFEYEVGAARFHSACFLQKYEKKERLHLHGAASLKNDAIKNPYC